MTAQESGLFDRSYWSERSDYRKFADYAAGLHATMAWHGGLLRLLRHELPPPGRALDVGCGHGAVVHLLMQRGWDMTGVDTSRWIIGQARNYAPELRDRFVVGDAVNLPGEARYDLITCLEVLEHLDDPVAALVEIRERLSPGGALGRYDAEPPAGDAVVGCSRRRPHARPCP